MNVSIGQASIGLPQRQGLLALAAGRAMVPPQTAGIRSTTLASPQQTVAQDDLQRLARYSQPNRGGLLIYSVTASTSASSAGGRVDVRV